MKAMIKLVDQTFNREIRSGDIVYIDVLEETKEEKCQCGLKYCICEEAQTKAVRDLSIASRKAIEGMKG